MAQEILTKAINQSSFHCFLDSYIYRVVIPQSVMRLRISQDSYRVRMPLLHVYHIQSLQTLPAIVISLEKIGCGRQESSIFGVQLLIRDEFLDPDRKSGISKKNVEADWT